MDMKKVMLTLVVLGTLLGAGLGFAGNTGSDPTFPNLNSVIIDHGF
ncbi:hypothetical protein BH24DEI2_BH24DEI2_02330 [soil metagenome]